MKEKRNMNHKHMYKAIVSIAVTLMFVLPGIDAVLNDEKTMNNELNNVINVESLDFTHTVFAEYGTETACEPCKYAHMALKNIYAAGWYPFYYVTFVRDKNKHAETRMISDYNAYATPIVLFDGGYKVDVGGSPQSQSDYNISIAACGNRNVSDIDVGLDVTWVGDAVMNIDVTIDNNEASTYDGYIRVYVTEISSTMGWKDTSGNPYTFTFLDYAFDENVSISSEESWYKSTTWDGHNHNDGHGHNFGNIAYGNIMVIAVVFNSEWHQGYAWPPDMFPFDAYWVDDATGFRIGDNNPPNTPSNPDPKNGEYNVDMESVLKWKGGDPDGDLVSYDVHLGTASPPPKVASNHSAASYDPGTLLANSIYYWQIVAWDTFDDYTEGPIWRFNTGNNSSPSPPVIDGPVSGKIREKHEYTFNATDPDGDDVYYWIDWDDGQVEEWIGPYESGEEVTLNHTWYKKGIYTIRAKAKDIHGDESEWATLEVTMPVSQELSSIWNAIQGVVTNLKRQKNSLVFYAVRLYSVFFAFSQQHSPRLFSIINR